MEPVFNRILKAKDNLEELIDSKAEGYLQDYYALFISEMAYWNYISLTPKLANKLYTIIFNTKSMDTDNTLNQITEFIIDKSIEDVFNESENKS